MKLSVVVPVRVGYGGDFLHRLQAFVSVQSELFERHETDAEIVIVEWNPPAEPRLLDAIQWPKSAFKKRIRIIEVPPEIHQKFPESDKFQIFEFIAKNVGIRRARGEYIVSVNADILFSDALVRWLSWAPFDPSCFYRVDRCDVEGKVPVDDGADAVLTFCKRNVVELALGAGNAFPGCKGLLNYQLGKAKLLWRNRNVSRGRSRLVRLHTNACGDFLLMHRDAWAKIQGYPEVQTYFHLDNYGVVNAACIGLRQQVLHDVIFHQNHHRAGNDLLPKTDFQKYRDEADKALTVDKPILKNDGNWGLGGHELAELVP